MSWETITVADIPQDEEKNFESIPAGRYIGKPLPTASLRPGKDGNGQELSFRVGIVDGPHTGRQVFFNYPDPAGINPNTQKSQAWSAKAFGKFAGCLGTEALPGETPDVYINRVGAEANPPTISFEMQPGQKDATKSYVNLWSVSKV